MIRPYVEATDLEELLDSWYEASLVAHPFLSSDFLERERVQIADERLPAAETTVSVVDGRVVGFLSLVGNEVGAIFVHPEYQGDGLGSGHAPPQARLTRIHSVPKSTRSRARINRP